MSFSSQRPSSWSKRWSYEPVESMQFLFAEEVRMTKHRNERKNIAERSPDRMLQLGLCIVIWLGLLAQPGCDSNDGQKSLFSGCSPKLQNSCMNDLWPAGCLPTDLSGSCTMRLINTDTTMAMEVDYSNGYSSRMTITATDNSEATEMTYLKHGVECNKYSIAMLSEVETVFTKNGAEYRMTVKGDGEEGFDWTCPDGSVESYGNEELMLCHSFWSMGQENQSQCTFEE